MKRTEHKCSKTFKYKSRSICHSKLPNFNFVKDKKKTVFTSKMSGMLKSTPYPPLYHTQTKDGRKRVLIVLTLVV